MSEVLRRLTIRGFKSIEELEAFELGGINILIGANGAGKSNFVEFFRFLHAIAEERLQSYINEQGGGDGFFYLGPKVTRVIETRLEFGDADESMSYDLDLKPVAHGGLHVASESIRYQQVGERIRLGSGASESGLKRYRPDDPDGPEAQIVSRIARVLSGWTVYHFHDSTPLAPVRRDQPARDRGRLREDASNIAAFLNEMKKNHRTHYDMVRDTIRLIAPFFDDFLLQTEERAYEERIRLEWTQKGTDFPFQPIHLSDGTLRFICLATALQQPVLPTLLVIDEPELGLHPFALALVADLIRAASERTQVVISTQSPTLLDYFAPEDVIVVNRREGQSTFERLDPDALRTWLDEYTVGELWQKNVVEGGPTHE
jgi:predicted ATPase